MINSPPFTLDLPKWKKAHIDTDLPHKIGHGREVILLILNWNFEVEYEREIIFVFVSVYFNCDRSYYRFMPLLPQD